MRYGLLGGSGLRVSDIGLGTLNFGENKPWGVERGEAQKILARYAERGGTLIDTAPNYAKGQSEDIVGEFLADSRDDFVLSTKYTASNARHILAGGNSARTMIRSLEDSLRRLRTDYVDLFWLHYWDGTTPLEEILKAVEILTMQGKIRYFGFSDTPAWLVSRAATMAEIRGWARPVAVQVEYSLAARGVEDDFLPMADALNLGVVAWGPLAAGALSGGDAPARRSEEALPSHIRRTRDQLLEIAAQGGVGLPDLALGHILGQSRPPVLPLLGARSVEQLDQMLDCAERDTDPALLNLADKATRPRPGFPNALIGSDYLARLALGEPDRFNAPDRPRA